MDFLASPSSSSSSPPVAAPETWQWAGAAVGSGFGSAACELACRVLCAAVGSMVGVVTGSMIGLATESGMLRGAGIGAISGAVFSIEVAEWSRDLWHSSDSGVVWSFLYMVDIISSLLSGRLVSEKVGLAVQSAVQSEISAISSPFAETSDLFETGGTKGLPVGSLHRLPKIRTTEEDAVDSAGEALFCPVCLQDFQVGESARRLPSCRHVFHMPCIDCWLVRHGSCPLCRRDI